MSGGVSFASGVSEVMPNLANMPGQVSSSQIASVMASQVMGSITATQITAVSAVQISGTISASQIQSITATQVVGMADPGQTLTGGTLIGFLQGVNLNTNADQPLVMTPGIGSYFIRNITWTNASSSLFLAGIIGSIRTGTGGSGTAVSTSLGLAGLINPADVVNSTLAVNTKLTAPQLYVRLTSLLGFGGTVSLYVFGDIII